MCGLFGAVGKTINTGTVRALALANRERGTDSLGFFDNSGKIVKTAVDPLDGLTDRGVSKFLNHRGRWFLAGHTRYATRGKVNKRNAHPFRYGNIVGSHNGHVLAPAKYKVDSEFIFDRLNEAGGDYQVALDGISGYWALTWTDGDAFYATAYKNSLWFGLVDGTLYYSSARDHLLACIGDVECFELTGGRTLQFTPDGYQELKPFSTVRQGEFWPEDDGADDVWADEWDKAAVELGYVDLDDLMEVEGFRNRNDAYEFIECYWNTLTTGERRTW